MQIFTCGQDPQNQPVARKSFFRSSTVQLSWNQGSTGLLVVVQSDVDKTNQSYYGESKLNYLTTDGSYEGLVPLRMFHLLSLYFNGRRLIVRFNLILHYTFAGKEGPVHDVQWSYSGLEFAVVYGCILFSLSLWLQMFEERISGIVLPRFYMILGRVSPSVGVPPV